MTRFLYDLFHKDYYEIDYILFIYYVDRYDIYVCLLLLSGFTQQLLISYW